MKICSQLCHHVSSPLAQVLCLLGLWLWAEPVLLRLRCVPRVTPD